MENVVGYVFEDVFELGVRAREVQDAPHAGFDGALERGFGAGAHRCSL